MTILLSIRALLIWRWDPVQFVLYPQFLMGEHQQSQPDPATEQYNQSHFQCTPRVAARGLRSNVTLNSKTPEGLFSHQTAI